MFHALRNGSTREQLEADLKAIVRDAETLLSETGREASEDYAAARERFERTLLNAKEALSHAQAEAINKGKAAAKATDTYVHEHPWQAIGLGACAGIIVGLLIGKR